MAYKKLLFILFSWSLLWSMMAGRIPGAHSARLKLQSASATFYGGRDAYVTVATSPKPAPAPAPIINDEKKGVKGGLCTPPAAPTDSRANSDVGVTVPPALNDSKFLIVCNNLCCGMNYHGPCSKCCRKGPPRHQ